MERLARGFGEVLAAVATDPGRRVAEIPIPALDGVPEPARVGVPPEERLGAVRRTGSVLEEAPRSPLEEAVAEIWRDVLGVDALGIHQDFFDLGGHSLLATQVVARLEERLERSVSIADLFEEPTVAGLAERIVRREADAIGDDDLADLLSEIDDLSEDEVEELLREKERA